MRTDAVHELSGFGEFTPRPFPIDLKRIGSLAVRLAAVDGSVARAACTWFQEQGIDIVITDSLGEPLTTEALPSVDGRGTILAGRHRKGTEAVFVAAALGGAGVATSIFAKPPSMQAQGVAAIAEKMAATDVAAATRVARSVLPLTTTAVARDRPWAAPVQKLLWWAGMRQALPLAEEVRASNDASSALAAERLGVGQAVLLFPQGQIRWAKRHWRPGLGRLLHNLTPEQRANTDVRFFDIQNYPSYRYVATLLKGISPPTESVRLRLSSAYPADALVDAVPDDSVQLTRSIQDIFNNYFMSGPKETGRL